MENKEDTFVNKNKSTVGFGLIETILIIIITAILAGVSTWVIFYSKNESQNKLSCASLTSDQDLEEFLKVYSDLTTSYYENVDKKLLLESAIDGMMNYFGDAYTTLLNEDETNALSESLAGIYKGIGVGFRNRTIVKVYSDTPAAASGLKEGDIIENINDKEASSMTDNEISDFIKNQDVVNLIVTRNTEKLNFKIELKTIDYPAVTYEVKENNIGYLYISTFSNTVARQVKKALTEIEKSNIKGLVLDVRGNSGGYLSACNDIAEYFLDEGQVIYTLSAGTQQVETKDATKEKREYPIVVLIDKDSASAAEILAAALKDSYGATLVGTTSYGKGKVQQTKNLSDGTMIKYTTARWLRPNGECIDGMGLKPDYEIKLEIPDDNEEMVDVTDTQLEKALELLN